MGLFMDNHDSQICLLIESAFHLKMAIESEIIRQKKNGKKR